MKHRSLPTLLASLAITQLPLPAQASVPTSASPLPQSFRLPIHTAAADRGVDYGTWACGRSYKVSFHDGMTFVPFLGADYPHNQPISWSTTSVRVGEIELLEPGELPVHGSAPYRYEYRYGAVTEAYDVMAEGLEQTFVFDRLPASGDLVITGRVESRLHTGDVAPAHQALEFHDAAGRAIVRYGQAFAIDAGGDRIELTTGHEGGQITLHVPSAWLAQAAFPIVVDPFFSLPGTVAVFTNSNGLVIQDVDVGRDDDATSANVMVAYSIRPSGGDSDVFAVLTNDDFGNGTAVYGDVTSNWDADHPSCAYVGGADRWAMVFRRYFVNTPVPVSQLRCHVRDSGNTVLDTSYISLAPPAGRNDWRPDVGGVEGFATGGDALVVFQRENTGGVFAETGNSDVYGALIDLTGVTGFGPSFPIQASVGNDAERPSVNQVADGGGSFSWVCACQEYENFVRGDDWDVVARSIDSTGNVAPGVWRSDVAAADADHQMQPVVEGKGGRYAVLFSTTDLATTPGKTGTTRGKKLLIERFDWAHGAANPDPAGDQPPVVLQDSAFRLWRAAGLGFDSTDASHFAPVYLSSATSGPAVYYAIVGYDGQPTEGPATFSTPASQAVACTFDNDHRSFLIPVTESPLPIPAILGWVLEYRTPQPAGMSGSSCSAAVLRWSGNQQIGSEFERIIALNAPAGAGHFMLVSLATVDQMVVNPAVLPGCRLLVDNGAGFLGSLAFQVGQGSTASWYFPLPSWLPPLTLHFQDWILNGSTFESSRRLSVPVIR